jgi:Flp pilus assembly protein TadD
MVGIAINSIENAAETVLILDSFQKKYPSDSYILSALISIERDQGNIFTAISYAEKLLRLMPNDRSVKQLLNQLKALRND